jgi:hypothetical protein
MYEDDNFLRDDLFRSIVLAIRGHAASLRPDERTQDIAARLKGSWWPAGWPVGRQDVEYLLDLVSFLSALIHDMQEESGAYQRGVADGKASVLLVDVLAPGARVGGAFGKNE